MSPTPLHDVAPMLDPIRDLTAAEVTHPVSPETARVLLHLEPVGRLVLTDARGEAVVLPVNHRLERDGSLLMRTARGTKLRTARQGGPEVAFEVDRVDEHGRGWVVVATGPLDEVLDLTEQARLDRTPGADTYADDGSRDRWLRLTPTLLQGYRLGVVDPDTEAIPEREEAAEPISSTDRGGLQVLDLDTCYALVRAAPVGRVAYVDAGEPLVLPVNHRVIGRRIVFRTAAGSKSDAAERARPVAFEVDGYDAATRTGWSVLVRGMLDVMWDDDEIAAHAHELPQVWADGIERDRIVVITPTSVTGRRIVRIAEGGS